MFLLVPAHHTDRHLIYKPNMNWNEPTCPKARAIEKKNNKIKNNSILMNANHSDGCCGTFRGSTYSFFAYVHVNIINACRIMYLLYCSIHGTYKKCIIIVFNSAQLLLVWSIITNGGGPMNESQLVATRGHGSGAGDHLLTPVKYYILYIKQYRYYLCIYIYINNCTLCYYVALHSDGDHLIIFFFYYPPIGFHLTNISHSSVAYNIIFFFVITCSPRLSYYYNIAQQ